MSDVSRPAQQIGHAIAAVAQPQRGNISSAQLQALGFSRARISRWVQRGLLFREHFGVYSVGHPPLAVQDRAAAAVLACGPGALLGHRSALSLWGLADHWEVPFHVVARTGHRRKGIVVHRACILAAADRTSRMQVPVTSLARTLLDCARALGPKRLSSALIRARRDLRLKDDEVVELLERCPRHPGARLLRAELCPEAGPAWSELERDFQTLIDNHGLPQPRFNVPLNGRIVDVLFPQHGLIVELDGYGFHADRQAFESDRERDAEHLELGLPTVRITRERVRHQPAREARRLARILAQRAGRGPDEP